MDSHNPRGSTLRLALFCLLLSLAAGLVGFQNAADFVSTAGIVVDIEEVSGNATDDSDSSPELTSRASTNTRSSHNTPSRLIADDRHRNEAFYLLPIRAPPEQIG